MLDKIIVFIVVIFFGLSLLIGVSKEISSSLNEKHKTIQRQTKGKNSTLPKVIYIICSIPVLLVFFESFLKFRFILEHESTPLEVIITFVGTILLLYIFYLNYSLINKAYSRNLTDKKIILVLSCLAGVFFIIPGPVALLGFLFLIFAPIMNVFIVYENSKNTK